MEQNSRGGRRSRCLAGSCCSRRRSSRLGHRIRFESSRRHRNRCRCRWRWRCRRERRDRLDGNRRRRAALCRKSRGRSRGGGGGDWWKSRSGCLGCLRADRLRRPAGGSRSAFERQVGLDAIKERFEIRLGLGFLLRPRGLRYSSKGGSRIGSRRRDPRLGEPLVVPVGELSSTVPAEGPRRG